VLACHWLCFVTESFVQIGFIRRQVTVILQIITFTFLRWTNIILHTHTHKHTRINAHTGTHTHTHTHIGDMNCNSLEKPQNHVRCSLWFPQQHNNYLNNLADTLIKLSRNCQLWYWTRHLHANVWSFLHTLSESDTTSCLLYVTYDDALWQQFSVSWSCERAGVYQISPNLDYQAPSCTSTEMPENKAYFDKT
jgi:hypothetical protein